MISLYPTPSPCAVVEPLSASARLAAAMTPGTKPAASEGWARGRRAPLRSAYTRLVLEDRSPR